MPTADFTGREWVLDAVAAWLAAGEGRHFLLTGEPGSGKSAIARRLAAVSAGAAPAHGALGHGCLAAAHFCSARDGTSIEPRAFARQVAAQLAATLPGYAQALLQSEGGREIRIDVQQDVGAADSVIGVQIQTLALSGADAQQSFNRLVAEPLQAVYAAGHASPVTILVDGLDEALAADGTTVVRLLARSAGLPARVRFVVTSRRDARVLAELGVAEGLFLSAPAHAAKNRGDLERYAAARVDGDPALKAALAGGPGADAFARRVAESADGNFQYAVFLLAEVAAGRRAAGAMDGLPAGLDGLYLESLSRVVGGDRWATRYRPVMGALSVAREPLTDARLAAFSGLAETEVWDAIGALQQFVDETEEGGAPAFRLYHQSVVDFLQARHAGPARTLNPYFVVAAEAHAAVADACLGGAGGPEAWDDYALRHACAHLAGAAERPRPGRRDRAALVDLALSPAFQRAYVARFDDPVGLEGELERAVAAASAADPPAGPALVLDAALGAQGFAEAHLRPEPLFALARAGSLEAAERRLASLRADPAWRRAALLALAWTAARAAPPEARERLDRLGAEPLPFPLDVLRARIEADLADLPWAAAPLPPPPEPWVVAGILDRIGGGNAATGVEPLSVESGITGDEAPAYLAELDGPPLVAYAAAQPAEGDAAFRRYLAIHAGNAYAYYRNRSLWALLEPLLRHPEPAWTRAILQEILVAALSPGDRTAFREGLPLAVAAARARAEGGARSLRVLRERTDAAREAARQIDPLRGGGDPWAHHLRRLGALAEVHALLLDDHAAAEDLVAQMMGLPFGFAGFRYRACLEAADAAFLAGRAGSEMAEGAMVEAWTSAHNIQDFAFCARAAARVNALAALGWPGCAAALRFAEAPDAPELAAWHRVGEDFALRAQTSTKMEIPGWARVAATPALLAELHRVSVDELLAANPGSAGWTADTVLPPGTRVNVPDPGFIPMVAARLAAGALADAAATPDGRTRAIMRLVPHALPDPQSLDAVLYRLVIAARPAGAELKRIVDAVMRLLDSVGLENDGWAGPFVKNGVVDVTQSVGPPGSMLSVRPIME